MIEISDNSYFDGYKCTNITCPTCGVKGNDNITISGITTEAGSIDFPMAEYLCYKCGNYFSDIMYYEVEEVIIKKKIYHLKN